jgi:hypothetical protein
MNTMADSKSRWRKALPILLLVLGSLLLLLSTVAIWLDNLVLDTNRYVDTVAPLSQNQDIDTALANRMTNELFQAADVEGRLHEAFPDQIKFLAGPLTERLRGFAWDQAYAIFQSDGFNQLWTDANRTAHENIVALLTGRGNTISTEGDRVVLDLNPVTQELSSRLGDTGETAFGRLVDKNINLRFVIFDSPSLAKAQAATDLLSRIAGVLPFLALASFAGSIWLSSNRRRMVLFTGAGIAAAMVLLLMVLNIFREYYLGSVAASDLSVPAAAALFDTLIRFLKQGVRLMAVLGLVIVAGAAIAGPSQTAVRLRNTALRGVNAAGYGAASAGKNLGPVGAWIDTNKRLLQGAGLAVAALVLLLWNWPKPLDLLNLIIATGAYLLLVEFLAHAGSSKKG